MRTRKYSVVCEDNAQLYFIQALLSHPEVSLSLQFDEAFYKRFKCNNNKDVRKTYVNLVERFSYLSPYNLDILFIGIDYDSRDRKDFKKEEEELYAKLTHGKDKAYIFYPVQSIEHWLLFLRKRQENSAFTKNISKEIEGISRPAAKKLCYNDFSRTEKDLISSLLATADLDWLSHQSVSFLSFYNRLKMIEK